MTLSESDFIPISITLPKDILTLLDEVCEKQHLTRSELLRRSFGLYLKSIIEPPQAGIFVDASGTQVWVGLLTEQGAQKVSSGEWRCIKEF
jgi:hypothetical protein